VTDQFFFSSQKKGDQCGSAVGIVELVESLRCHTLTLSPKLLETITMNAQTNLWIKTCVSNPAQTFNDLLKAGVGQPLPVVGGAS
jgi:hypothetical protein